MGVLAVVSSVAAGLVAGTGDVECAAKGVSTGVAASVALVAGVLFFVTGDGAQAAPVPAHT